MGHPSNIRTIAVLGIAGTWSSPRLDTFASGAMAYCAPPVILDGYLYTDQAGTFNLQISIDDPFTAPRTFLTQAVVAATLYTWTGQRIPGRFFRINYVNGGVAQTVFELEFFVRHG